MREVIDIKLLRFLECRVQSGAIAGIYPSNEGTPEEMHAGTLQYAAECLELEQLWDLGY